MHANHWWWGFFFKDPQVPLVAKSGFQPWLPQEQTHGACAWVLRQQGSQLGWRPRPYWLEDAELTSSSLAEAASPVVASSELTNVPSWAGCAHDCLSCWNSLFGKTFQFFFIANGKWARKKQLTKIKFCFLCVYVSHRKLSFKGWFQETSPNRYIANHLKCKQARNPS
jgi:hypothetical protein